MCSILCSSKLGTEGKQRDLLKKKYSIYNYVTCVLLIPAMVDLKRRKQRHLFVTLFMIWYRNALHAAFQVQIEICFRESAHRNIRKTSGRYLSRHLDLLVIFLSNEFHLPQGIQTHPNTARNWRRWLGLLHHAVVTWCSCDHPEPTQKNAKESERAATTTTTAAAATANTNTNHAGKNTGSATRSWMMP